MKLIKGLNFFILSSVINMYFSANLPPTNYAFLFPSKPHIAAAIFWNVPISKQTRELTLSMWIHQLSKDTQNTYFSFALPKLDNAIAFGSHSNKWFLYISGKSMSSNQFVRINEWVHCAVSWRSKDGGVWFYVDGKLVHSELYENLKGIAWNDEDGSLVLGQDQDVMGGGFESLHSFRGEMTEVNVWDRKLNEYEVQQVYQSQLEGNIVAWSKTVWTLVNNISVVASTAHGLCENSRFTNNIALNNPHLIL